MRPPFVPAIFQGETVVSILQIVGCALIVCGLLAFWRRMANLAKFEEDLQRIKEDSKRPPKSFVPEIRYRDEERYAQRWWRRIASVCLLIGVLLLIVSSGR